MKYIPLCAALLFAPLAVSAQEVVLGAGFADFSSDGADDSVLFSVDYNFRPFYSSGRFDLGWGTALELDTAGDAFAGIGLVARQGLGERWFISASVLPGAYFHASTPNDLGSIFEIRSQLGVGYALNDTSSLSLAISHKSNATTADYNPGVNALSLRWHKSL